MGTASPLGPTRRGFLGSALVTAAAVAGCVRDDSDALLERPERPTPDQAIELLREGNGRWAEDRPIRPRATNSARRQAVLAGQHPFANVIGCVDSRVPVEAVFDRGLGDLLVTRLPGSIVVQDVVATAHFAVEEFGIPAVVVLGHENCGAVRAALDAGGDGSGAPGDVGRLIDALAPAVRDTEGTPEGERLLATVRRNIEVGVAALRADPLLSERIEAGELRVEGGYYTLESGRVDFV